MKSLVLISKIMLFCIFIFSETVIAQTNWAFHAPGIAGVSPTSPLVFNCIDRDPAGNIIVSSTTVDSIQFGPFGIAGFQPIPPDPIYTENAYFAKMNASGGVQWVNMISASVVSRIYDMKTDASGNIYVLGNVRGSATFDTISVAETYEMFLAKYNTNGQIEWLRLTSTPPTTDFPPQGRALSIGNEGKVYLSGLITEVNNFQGIEIDAGSETGYFIARYTEDGTPEWVRNYGIAYPYPLHEYIGLDLDANSNIYLSSSTVGVAVFDTIQVNATEGEAFFLAKFNDEGDIAWIDVIYYKFVRASRLVVDRQLNHIYVTGFFNQDEVQFGDIMLNLAVNPGTSMYLAKYDANKQVLWAQANYGDVRLTRTKSIDISPDGSVFVSGDYGVASQTGVGVVFGQGSDAVALKLKGTYDGFMTKFKSDGIVDWATPFSGPENDDAKAVCAYSNEIGVVSGILVDSIYIGDTAFFSQPIYYAGNFFLASCDGTWSPSWIVNPEVEEARFQLFPNPTSQQASVAFDDVISNSITVNIYDINGRLVEMQEINSIANHLTISGLQPGIYMVFMQDEKGYPLGSRKLVVR